MEFKKLPVLRGAGTPQVDFENDIIRDVVMVEEGEAKGHGVWLDSKFIKDIASQGNMVGSVKSRFGHPQMCGNSLGDFIGTFKNFSTRTNGDKAQAVADLHLDRIADKSPKYDKSIIDYVLNFASTNPDMFGNSIVFRGIEEERVVKEEGKQIKKRFMVLKDKGFSASDIVDDPAATSGMFSEFNIASVVTEFLQNSEIDLSEFDELMDNEAFTQFAEILLKNPKISHRILNIVMNNQDVYKEFKEKINEEKPINYDEVISGINNHKFN